MRKILFAAFVLMLSLSTAGYAANPGNPTGAKGSKFANKHPRRNQVNKRVKNQRAAIRKDVRNGTMSKKAAAQDRKEIDSAKQTEHAEVRANGGSLTPAEQHGLNQDLNATGSQIPR